jgi:hypothetical protein
VKALALVAVPFGFTESVTLIAPVLARRYGRLKPPRIAAPLAPICLGK